MRQGSLFERDVLPLFETYRGEWLDAARLVAAKLGSSGRNVTIDDVRKVCPPPPDVDPRVCGAVFTRREWIKVGYLNSTRSTCHHRPIAVFRMRGMEAAE